MSAEKDNRLDCETRRAITQAARKLFLHYGYKKTTIDDVAAEAGIGKGTVYLYFNNKEEIFSTIALEVKRNQTEEMTAIANSLRTPAEKLRQILHAKVMMPFEAINAAAHGAELVDMKLQPRLITCIMPEIGKQQSLLTRVLEDGVTEGTFDLGGQSAMNVAENLFACCASLMPPYFVVCPQTIRSREDFELRANELITFILRAVRRCS